MNTEGGLSGSYMTYVVNCPKHGEHPNTIRSTFPGHEGVWCQICWIESLGPPLPSTYTSVPLNTEESA